ncbi:MAG: sugar ABC transporter substrate-binding protein [Clostridiales bacterium]|nr:sugar ABC transporter substrate-binding protein [Clostridiales bacterium]MDU3241250.1 sugar ABC transporter substrate-binding protein [Clostridiales bacterium]
MKLKKVVTLTMAAAMALSLIACGGGSGSTEGTKAPETQAAGETQAAEETQAAGSESAENTASGDALSVMIWDANQEPGINQILGDFTTKTGIKTNLQVVTWDEYWTLLEAGAQGGTLPDVFWMHSNESSRYMSNDMLLDLTDKISGSDVIDPANYPEDIWGLYTYDEKYYAVPKDVDTVALVYNKKMFDDAGIAYPDDTWTWDTFVETAKKLTKEDGSQYGTAIRNTNNQDGYYNMIYDMGGKVISDDKKSSGYDDPNTIKGMQIIEQMIKDGSMPSQETMSETNPEALFTSGKVAMIPQGSWMVAYYRDNEYSKENASFAVIPSAPDGTRKTIYNGLGWAAAANGSHTDEAWQLIEYLGSKEAQEKQAQLGVTMSAYNGTSDAWAQSVPEFNLQSFLDVMKPENMVIRPYSTKTVTWENKVNEVLKSAWTGDKSMEDACKEAATEMNAILAEE